MDLTDRRVFVTGANRGLGAALVAVALERGAATVLAGARDISTLDDVVERAAGRIVPMRCDVTDPASVEAAAADAEADVVISNAGITCQQPILAGDGVDDFRRTMEVNYFGTLSLLKAFAGGLRERSGSILLILSVASVALSRSAPAYSASKAATLMLGSAVREELRPDVSVTISLPGWIDTDMAAALPGEKASAREVAEQSIEAMLRRDEIVWPDRFARLVRERVDGQMIDLLTRPRDVMNALAADFAAGKDSSSS